jgi:hypothetical protein
MGTKVKTINKNAKIYKMLLNSLVASCSFINFVVKNTNFYLSLAARLPLMSSPVPKKDMSVCQQQIVNVTSDKSSL